MKTEQIKTMVKYGLLIALVTVCTMVISIPVPATNGYTNLGDAMVFTSAILLGKKGGFIAGGIGSALADLLLGFSFWVPFTLIIKGLEGFIAGYLLETSFGKKHTIFALLPAAAWMITGYFIVKLFVIGWGPALMNLPVPIIQSSIGAVIATLLGTAILKTKVVSDPRQMNDKSNI
jgi:uncharacterized membrane protein